MKKSSLFLLITSFLWLFSACSDEQGDQLVEVDTPVFDDDAFAASIFEWVDDEVQRASTANEGGRDRQGVTEWLNDPCAQISRQENTRGIVIDFGDTNCEGADGKMRRGKILVSRSGTFGQGPAVTTITFRGFFVNDNQVEGIRKIERFRLDRDGNLQQRITLENGKISLPDGREIRRNASWVRTWLRGSNPREDAMLLEGHAHGVNRNGLAYRVEVLAPLMRKRQCFAEGIYAPVSGVKQLTLARAGEPRVVYRIDFGTGTCDTDVQVWKDGRGPRTITWGRR